jgi:hypothetical protein
MAVESRWIALQQKRKRTALILLGTNALIWFQARHRRSRPLSRWMGRVYISPGNLSKLVAEQDIIEIMAEVF